MKKKKNTLNEVIKNNCEISEKDFQYQSNKNRYFTSKDRLLIFYYNNKSFYFPEYGIRKFT